MQPTQLVEEPQGIGFFSVKTGETHYCKLEPTIQGYINSSDMGINASRGQDYGWRLDPEWVKKVREFKRDRTQMSILTSKNDGRKPTTTQILYYMYGEQLADYFEQLEENENPFEEAYLAAINSGKNVQAAAAESGMPQALADFRAIDEDEDITDLIDDAMEDEDDDEPQAPAPKQPKKTQPKKTSAPKQPKTVAVDPAKPGEDKSVETTVKVENGELTAPEGDGETPTRSQNQQK